MIKRFLVFLLTALPHIATAKALHDPTMPSNLPAPIAKTDSPFIQDQALILSATWISDHVSRATINGKVVRKGEALEDGAIVEKIKSHYVIVNQNGIRKKIELVVSIKTPRK